MKKQFGFLILALNICLTSIGSHAHASDINAFFTLAVNSVITENQQPLVILYPKGSLNNIQPVTEEFTKQTGINFILNETTVDDINTKMFLDAARNIANFDIAIPATFGIADLVEAGALLDLSDYASQYEPLVNYSPSLYSLGDSYKGQKYGYQTDGDVYLMFYNKDWLEDHKNKSLFKRQYGRPLSLPTSWQELDELMAFFNQPHKGRYGGCLFRTPSYMVWEWWIRFHANGIFPVDDHMRPNIANDEGVAALDAMLAATKHQHPAATTNDLFENWKLYAKGQCFANIGWGGSQKFFNSDQSALKGKIIHASTPGVSYFNWGWNYVVSKHTQYPELAYLFTLFATTSQGGIIAVRHDGFFDPFRTEHYTDAQIEKVYTSSFLNAHKQAMLNAMPDFYLQGQGRYNHVLQEAILAAHDGHVSPREALEYAARQWEDITNDIGRKSQIKQWLKLKEKYPKSFLVQALEH